jgi:hypothetical protein
VHWALGIHRHFEHFLVSSFLCSQALSTLPPTEGNVHCKSVSGLVDKESEYHMTQDSSFEIFIGWSGPEGKTLASVLSPWINAFFRGNVLSKTYEIDVPVGTEINRGIREIIKNAKVAIFCLTKDRLTNPWPAYEAGHVDQASGDEALIIPLLMNMAVGDEEFIRAKELNPILSKRAISVNREDIKKMLQDINDKLEMQYLPNKFESKFEDEFPALWERIKQFGDGSTNGDALIIRERDGDNQLTAVEFRILWIFYREGISEKSFLTDGIKIKKLLEQHGFSNEERKMALLLLQSRNYVEKIEGNDPTSYKLTYEGEHWIESNIKDFFD